METLTAFRRMEKIFWKCKTKIFHTVGCWSGNCKKGEGKVVEVVRLRPEKDDSDTQSAMNYAIQNGAKEIVILGVTGNRVDHLMANFGLLILAQKQDTEVALADRYNYMKLIPSGTILKKSRTVWKVRVIFPVGRRCDRSDTGRI